MAANWNQPALTDTYTNFLAYLKARDEQNCKLDHSSDTNLPTGAVQLVSADGKFQTWGGSSWSDVALTNLKANAVTTTSITADAVTTAKFRGSNNSALRWRNAADSADINALLVGSDNNTYLKAATGQQIVFGDGAGNWLLFNSSGNLIPQKTTKTLDLGASNTRFGNLYSNIVDIANAAALRWRNAADSGTIDAVRVDGSDHLRIGSASVASTYIRSGTGSIFIAPETGATDDQWVMIAGGNYSWTDSMDSGAWIAVAGNAVAGNEGKLILATGTNTGDTATMDLVASANGSFDFYFGQTHYQAGEYDIRWSHGTLACRVSEGVAFGSTSLRWNGVYSTLFDAKNNTGYYNRLAAGTSSSQSLYLDGSDHLFVNSPSSKNIYFSINGTSKWSVGSDGKLIPTSNETLDLGTTSYRVNNLYTKVLNLSGGIASVNDNTQNIGGGTSRFATGYFTNVSFAKLIATSIYAAPSKAWAGSIKVDFGGTDYYIPVYYI